MSAVMHAVTAVLQILQCYKSSNTGLQLSSAASSWCFQIKQYCWLVLWLRHAGTPFDTTPEVVVGLQPALDLERFDDQPEMGLGLTKDEFAELLALQVKDWSKKYHLNQEAVQTFLKYQDTKDHIWYITAGQVGSK